MKLAKFKILVIDTSYNYMWKTARNDFHKFKRELKAKYVLKFKELLVNASSNIKKNLSNRKLKYCINK